MRQAAGGRQHNRTIPAALLAFLLLVYPILPMQAASPVPNADRRLTGAADTLQYLLERRDLLAEQSNTLLRTLPHRLADLLRSLPDHPDPPYPAIRQLIRELADQLSHVPKMSDRVDASEADFRKQAQEFFARLQQLPLTASSASQADHAQRFLGLGLHHDNLFTLSRESAALDLAIASAEKAVRLEAAAAAGAEQTVPSSSAQAPSLPQRVSRPVLIGLGLLAGVTIGLALCRPFSRRNPRPAIPQSPSPAPDNIIPDAAGNGLLVLIAEDEPVSRQTAVLLLERAGFRVIAVNDGRQALDQLATQPVDLALIDNQMPKVDGLTVCRSLQDAPVSQRPRLGMILLTANLHMIAPETLRSLGIAAAMAKPLRLDELTRHIRQLEAAQALPSTLPDSPGVFHTAKQGHTVEQGSRIFNPDAITIMLEHLSEARVVDLIGGAIATLDSHAIALTEAWEGRNLQSCTSLAHKIAGVAALYGGEAVHAQARALEIRIDAGNTADAEPHYERLRQSLPQTLTALTRERLRLQSMMQTAG